MAILSNPDLADLLEWAAGRIRAGDSFEGSIQYTYADDGNRVSAAVRYDNRNGQGMVRLIEDEEIDGVVQPVLDLGKPAPNADRLRRVVRAALHEGEMASTLERLDGALDVIADRAVKRLFGEP